MFDTSTASDALMTKFFRILSILVTSNKWVIKMVYIPVTKRFNYNAFKAMISFWECFRKQMWVWNYHYEIIAQYSIWLNQIQSQVKASTQQCVKSTKHVKRFDNKRILRVCGTIRNNS